MSQGATTHLGTRKSEFDTWEVLEVITQETRKDIIADIVGHPKGMPSMKELDYLNTIDRSTIAGHLQKLIDAGVVGTVTFPPGQRPDEGPYKFYYITDQARELFDRNDIFDPSIRRSLYAQVRKPPEVKHAEELTRPQID